MSNIIKFFKGGSLSRTYLMSNGNDFFVRKDVSLTKNREYGFQRWYSQMKRLQRYSVNFPGLFPQLLNYGKNGDMAYFDIEYFPKAVNAQEYLYHCKNVEEIDEFFDVLIKSISIMYKEKMVSGKDAMALYINEEIEQRLKDCYKNEKFVEFIKHDYIVFNGVEIKSFVKSLDEYKKMCKDSFKEPKESFTHGNITLENILYVPDEKRVILIDPYEENVIDSELAEFSQLLQSSNSKYEIYNGMNADVKNNVINLKIEDNFGIDYFNSKLLNYITSHYSTENYIVIRLLEISQFIRMLPFKMEVDENKMYFFYGLASMLFHNLKEEIEKGELK